MNVVRNTLILSICGIWLGLAHQQAQAQDAISLPDAPVPAAVAGNSAALALPKELGRFAPDPQDQKPAVDTSTGVAQREATWRSVPGDFLHDQKDLWTFPIRLAKGHYLLPTAIVVGGTVALIVADPHDSPYFRNHQKNWDDFNDVFDPMITTGEVVALPVGLLAAGYIRHDDREVNTAILAAEAYGDSVVIDLAMKAVTRRERPSDVAPNGNWDDTFFNGGKSPVSWQQFSIRTRDRSLVGGDGGGGAIQGTPQALDSGALLFDGVGDQFLAHH
jgi:hypothetical protein